MNYLKSFFLLSFIILGTVVSQAQIRHTFHETYNLKEIQSVSLDLEGDVKYLSWKGTSLMIEVTIQLENANKGTLNYLVKEKKRYDLKSNSTNATLSVESLHKDRKAVMTRDGTCDEYVGITVYYPDEFEVEGENTLKRTDKKAEEPAATTTGAE